MRGLTAPLAPQVGGGRYKPRVLVPPGKSAAVLQGGLAVEHFDYAPALAEHIAGCATFPPRLCACFLPHRTARLGQRVTAVRCWAGPWMRRARQPGAERRCMRAVPVQGGLWTLRIRSLQCQQGERDSSYQARKWFWPWVALIGSCADQFTDKHQSILSAWRHQDPCRGQRSRPAAASRFRPSRAVGE